MTFFSEQADMIGERAGKSSVRKLCLKPEKLKIRDSEDQIAVGHDGWISFADRCFYLLMTQAALVKLLDRPYSQGRG